MTHGGYRKLRDLALCVLTALAIIVGMLLYAVYQADTGHRAGLPLKWIGLAVNTPAVFWFGLRPFRHRWHLRSVKLFLVVMLAAHLAAFSFVLTRIANWPLLWYIPSDFLEIAVIFTVLDKLIYRTPPSRHRGRVDRADTVGPRGEE